LIGYAPIAESYPNELPRLFTDAGYRTHAVGKMHFNPIRNTHGYESVLLEEGWHSVLKNKYKCDYQEWFERVAPNQDLNATGLHYTDHRGGKHFLFPDTLHPTYWTAQKAIDFLDSYQEEKPWLLKVSFQRPHPPFDPPERWLDHYENVDFPMPRTGAWAEKKYKNKYGSLDTLTNATSAIFPDQEIRASRQAYFAAISYVDEQIGRVLEALRKRGEWENTLILFTADHGDMMGDQHQWRKCRPYDPSARIPMIIRWPGSMKIQAIRGQMRNELVELRDVLPTFLQAAGLNIPGTVNGLNMLNVLDNNGEWREVLDLEHSRIYEPDNAWTCLIDRKWKYIYFTLTGEQQLFNLKNDPYELHDLSKQPSYKEELNTWRAKMIRHLEVRGENWVKDGNLVIQDKSGTHSPNYPSD